METTVKAPAKVNLFLRMDGKREDGYHLLYSCMQTLSLYDVIEVSVEPAEGKAADVSFFSDCGFLTSDPKKNTVVAAAVRFMERIGPEKYTVSIGLQKNIPSQAGLGGGSSDAAAVLLAMDSLFPGKVSKEELADIALSIGADVPFFLCGGTALCEGVGEILTPMPDLSGMPMLLLKPQRGVSTPTCYKAFDAMGAENISDEEKKLLKDDLSGDEAPKERLIRACRAWTNDLQLPAIQSVPEIQDGLDLLSEGGAIFSAMSGSGSAVFGIFESGEAVDRLMESPKYQELIRQGWWSHKAQTL
ncbi:MAG: 4-(cytidine 5'-diphospho)-2-C-methyl-D-erythritol kinase [Clostridiales bacterium]|nr:4-(cytidine 5'-diphospho)-2-C-methyl-D-erythritol kinase [Clostridiales bacterium]